MSPILLKNLDLLDVHAGVLKTGHQVLVKDGLFAEVSDGAIKAAGAEVVDLGGRTLMPGLIDCHAHVTSTKVKRGNWAAIGMLPSLVTATASQRMLGMLMRGFTTVRDAAGADLGHKQAVEQGLFVGPRLFVSGRGLSQTGGHGDLRSRADLTVPCPCNFGGVARIADGVDAVRRVARDEIRLGADQIKVMASGGVSSPADPIDFLQYSMDELKAIVDEATRSHTYVLAHTYTAEAIKRCVEAGIRSIEHGNFIDGDTAKMMAKAGAYFVPTLITYRKLVDEGHRFGLQDHALEKAKEVLAVGTRSLDIAKAAGVKIAFGTDLVGELQPHQSQEFEVRAEVLSPAEIIHSATLIGAEVVRMEGKLGVIAPGALADALVVDGNPLDDLGLMQDQGAHMPAIMKDGAWLKNTLGGGDA
ncbi:MAG: amidohydrolase family protein [Rhodospirillales bacterium]|jgi:imidazolonepropionase-like amidohydrolase|nr:amidohydrolase family protein [Rhodospirillales bacterium]MDP6883652.1 amidohydrolase family protein [Rhodospirillales bacterium]